MPSLDKSTLSLTFKFDCDRFLRFRLASDTEKAALGLRDDTDYRPGMMLIRYAGRRWEADKYQDLIDVAKDKKIEYRLDQEEDPNIGRKKFLNVENLFDILRQDVPPFAIIEGEFPVPTTITPALQEAYDTYGLDRVRARPDIIWLRPAFTGAPLIGGERDYLEYEIHIIDVKMAAEPSLRHFTEVTYYALALAEALSQEGLSDRYAVSAEGFIWPGSNDVNEFRNRFRELESKGGADPLTKALMQTLIAVPYEVYQVHVKQFFEERMLRVLGQSPLDAAWHVGPKCQLCEHLVFCLKQAGEMDHLSRIPWLNQGQADLIRKNGIATTQQLSKAVRENSPEWIAISTANQQLRAESGALRTRAEALESNQAVLVDGRRCRLMPRWSDLNIYITVHFDMGSGISFALGAMRVYFPPGRTQGDPPQTDERVFIVDRVNNLSPDTERARLIEFIELVTGWLTEISDYNATVPSNQQLSAHIYLWDGLELKQLGRMFSRHMSNPAVVEKIELLMRLFPPESMLPDPELFRSQPITAVKEVVRMLVGLPLPHDYTLLDVANVFFPFTNSSGEVYKFDVPYGFKTPMTDQIPFERAYELWQDKIMLRKFNSMYPTQPSRWPKYTRDEIYEGIKKAVRERLKALNHVVGRLKQNYGEKLTLRKSPFRAAPPVQTRVPEQARKLIAFTKLNAVVDEIKNRQDHSLPIEEREARFISIRGLLPAPGPNYDDLLNQIRSESQFTNRRLLAMTFSPNSRDCRIREGDFLLALSNEDSQADLDLPWYQGLQISFYEGVQLLADAGLNENWLLRAPLAKLLQVELVRLESTENPPFLVLAPADPRVFQFAQDQELIYLERPMVLDPIYQDFHSDRIRYALKLVGGDPPTLRRRRQI